MTQVAQYYQDYWKVGIGRWRPAGEDISLFERRLLTNYVSDEHTVLDFGCGDGAHVGEYIASLARQYLGADVSEEAVSSCRSRGLMAQVCMPDRPLPFATEAFDLVVSFEVLEHLFAPADVASELKRVLRPGGHFVGSVPNSASLGNRLLALLGYFNAGGAPATSIDAPWRDPHIRFFTRATLWRFLEEAGFRVIGVWGPPFSLLHLPVLHRATGKARRVAEVISRPIALAAIIWPALFAYRLYFAAQKPPARS